MSDKMDMRVSEAIIKIADTLEDISQKLDYIIKKQSEDFYFGEYADLRRWAK